MWIKRVRLSKGLYRYYIKDYVIKIALLNEVCKDSVVKQGMQETIFFKHWTFTGRVSNRITRMAERQTAKEINAKDFFTSVEIF